MLGCSPAEGCLLMTLAFALLCDARPQDGRRAGHLRHQRAQHRQRRRHTSVPLRLRMLFLSGDDYTAVQGMGLVGTSGHHQSFRSQRKCRGDSVVVIRMVWASCRADPVCASVLLCKLSVLTSAVTPISARKGSPLPPPRPGSDRPKTAERGAKGEETTSRQLLLLDVLTQNHLQDISNHGSECIPACTVCMCCCCCCWMAAMGVGGWVRAQDALRAGRKDAWDWQSGAHNVAGCGCMRRIDGANERHTAQGSSGPAVFRLRLYDGRAGLLLGGRLPCQHDLDPLCWSVVPHPTRLRHLLLQ